MTEARAIGPLQFVTPAMDDGTSESVRRTFREIFRSEAGAVWNTLRRMGVREPDLEDVTHEVFITLYRHLPTLDLARPVRPWLAGVAVRAAAQYRRRSHIRREVATDVIDEPDAAPRPDQQLIENQGRADVLAALDALDDERRAVFVLCEIEERTMPDVAAALAIPLNTGYSRLRLARADFTAAIDRIRRKRGER